MKNLSVPQRYVAGVILLVVALTAAGVIGYQAVTHFAAVLESHKPSYATLDAINRVRSLSEMIEIAGRSVAVSGDKNARSQYLGASEQIGQELDNLRKLTANSPLQQERVTTLAGLVRERIDVINRIIKAPKAKKQTPAAQTTPQKQETAAQPTPQKQETAAQPTLQKQETAAQPTGRSVDMPVSRQISTILDRMEEDAKHTINAQSEDLRSAARRPALAAMAAGAAAIALAALAYFFILWEMRQRQRTERMLQDSQARFGLLSDGAKEYALALLDPKGSVTAWNAGAERMFGYSADEIRGKYFFLFYPEDQARLLAGRRLEATALQGRAEDEGMRLRRDGTSFPARETMHALRDAGGGLTGYATVTQDLTEQRRAEDTIMELGLSLENASDLAAITRPDGTIEYVNHAFEDISGYTKDELIGKTLAVLHSRGHSVTQPPEGPQTAEAGERPNCRVSINLKKNGEHFYLSETISQLADSEGKATHLIMTARDITRQKNMEDAISFLVHYDTLTGLSNRDDFQERLKSIIAQRKNHGEKTAVLAVTIDRFNYVNDVFGSNAGNTVLKQVALRIREIVGTKGMTARLAGDEFGVLLGNVVKPADVVSAVGSIIENVSRGIEVDGRNVFVTLSVGAALYPTDGEDAETLVKNADVALAQAKAAGINSFRFYSAEVNARVSELVEMEQQLFGALRNEEYDVVYQPYCELEGKNMVGAEALIRWINRDLGVVSPARFIRTLESTGMIIDVGAWVLRTVCNQLKKMNGRKKRLPFSVNLSPAQFRHDRLVEMVEETIKAAKISPKLINLEVTESVFMEDILFTQSVLKQLKRIGVAISIDDFGTGYSSLSYLKKLPVDVIKIDQSFVKDVTTDPDTATIVTSITTMARSLGIKTIAEGVETEEQWKVLRLLRCDMGQGYYFSPALKVGDFERYHGLGE